MFISALLILISTYVANTWLGGLATAVLLVIWRIIPKTEGPPVLKLAMTMQWLQVTAGMYYVGLTGEALDATEKSDWQPMVMIGLGVVLAISIGLSLGVRWMLPRYPAPEDAPAEVGSLKVMLVTYLISISATAAAQAVAWQYPGISQAIFAIGGIRLALLYLVLRRLVYPDLRWGLIVGLLGFETLLGFSGFFSGFKEPMLLAGMAVLEGFNPRRREHLVFGAGLAIALVFLAVMWMGVRTEFRQSFEDEAFETSRSARLERMQSLTTDWWAQSSGSFREDVSRLVDRVWVIYYPALAVARVPSVIPHTDGELMKAALLHVFTPRLLFPNKPDLPNESEYVRKYAGIWVAGAEEGTSIAFGYAAESYVDFGVPVMFLPPLAFGVLMGGAYVWFLRNIHHRELAIALVTCIFWLNLYTFEKSWARLLGLSLTTMAYLGGVVFLIDRWLLMRAEIRAEHDAATGSPASPAFGTNRQ